MTQSSDQRLTILATQIQNATATVAEKAKFLQALSVELEGVYEILSDIKKSPNENGPGQAAF